MKFDPEIKQNKGKKISVSLLGYMSEYKYVKSEETNTLLSN